MLENQSLIQQLIDFIETYDNKNECFIECKNDLFRSDICDDTQYIKYDKDKNLYVYLNYLAGEFNSEIQDLVLFAELLNAICLFLTNTFDEQVANQFLEIINSKQS